MVLGMVLFSFGFLLLFGGKEVMRVWRSDVLSLPTVTVSCGYHVSPEDIINYVLTYIITCNFTINMPPLISEPHHVVLSYLVIENV